MSHYQILLYFAARAFAVDDLNSTDEEKVVNSPLPDTEEAVAIACQITSPPGTRINITVEDFVISHQYPPRFTCEYARVFVHDSHNGNHFNIRLGSSVFNDGLHFPPHFDFGKSKNYWNVITEKYFVMI